MRLIFPIACAFALVAAQVLYGGLARPVFALPAYLILGAVGVLAVITAFRRGISTPVFSCLAATLAFAGFLIFKEMHAPDLWLAGGYLRLTLACLVIYLLFACVITDTSSRVVFFVLLLLMAMGQAVLGAIQFANRGAGMPLPWISEQVRLWYEGRFALKAHGFFLNGNHLAWLLNTAGVMALSLGCWGRWAAWKKILSLYVAAVCLAGTVLCLSRAGMLGLLTSLAIFFLLSAVILIMGARDRRLVVLLMMMGGLLLAAGSFFLVYQNSFEAQSRFAQMFQDDYRPQVWAAVVRQFQLSPETGTGAGTFLYWGRAYREMMYLSDDVYAHNDWMQLAADFGYPALALLVVFWLVHVGVGYRGFLTALRERMLLSSRPESHTVALLLGALACLGGFTVHSFFDFNMQIPANALLAAAIVGLLANAGLSSEKADSWLARAVRALGLMATVGGAVWLLFLSVQAVRPEWLWLRAENAVLFWDMDQAEALAKQGLELTPAHPRLHRVVGESLLRRSALSDSPAEQVRYAQAAAVELTRCVALAPLDRTNHLGEAEAWIRAGDATKAQAAALEVILRDPTQAQGYEFYAISLEMMGRYREAARYYELARALPGSVLAANRWEMLQKKLNPPPVPRR